MFIHFLFSFPFKDYCEFVYKNKGAKISLLKKEYSLQYIMTLLDVSISSLGNYVENKDIIASGNGKMDQLHPLEEFWNEIECGLK